MKDRFEIDWFGSSVFPEGGGVYVIYLKDGHVYVGSAGNLRKRLEKHPFIMRSQSVRCDLLHVKFKRCYAYGYWLMLEARLIKKMKPDLNLRGHCGFKSAVAYEAEKG